MRMLRPAIAADPRLFGRRLPSVPDPARPASPSIREDLNLFATSFTVGFLFVAVLIF
jgi:hypothetical protein